MADGNRRYKSDKKLYKVSFKLSEEDKRLLEEGAKKGWNDISEYLRNLVRGGGKCGRIFYDRQREFYQTDNRNCYQCESDCEGSKYPGIWLHEGYPCCKQDLEDVKRLMREVLMVWQSLRYSA